MGGCSMPIAALATIDANHTINFKGNILTIDGKEKAEVEMIIEKINFAEAGKIAAEKLLQNGGDVILKKVKG
jgi:hydroxymethylbilane synthase